MMRGGVLDLSGGGKRNADTQQAGAEQQQPVVEGAHVRGGEDVRDLTGAENEREEEEGGVEVVVQGDLPGVVVDEHKLLLDEDGVHGDEEGGGDAEEHAQHGPAHLLDVSERKAGHDEGAAHHGLEGGDLAQHDVVEDDVEHNGERARHLVEGDLDVLEAQVVEDDHGGEHQRQRQHLLEDVAAHLERRHVGDAQAASHVAEEHGDDALRPGDEEGRGGAVLAAEQRLVGKHHGDGDDPVEAHGHGNVAHLARQRLRRGVIDGHGGTIARNAAALRSTPKVFRREALQRRARRAPRPQQRAPRAPSL
ncbi:GDP-fucose transporter [Gracilaria domingensis]|nr:GDP-fucose transporter [Gracilaria domingensis]